MTAIDIAATLFGIAGMIAAGCFLLGLLFVERTKHGWHIVKPWQETQDHTS